MTARAIIGALVALAATVVPAVAFDPDQRFHKGALLFSVEGGYGEQDNFGDDFESGMKFWNTGVRLGLVPFAPIGAEGPLHGALEIGFEPFFQRYFEPRPAFFAGAAAVGRYHFLDFGRVVPYIELAGAAGRTDLKVAEIRSSFTFLLFGGVGASVFITDHAAVYAGWRYQHVSNGNTSFPNRGFESHTAVVGFSYFLR
jgi:opacity protein-like surface antigen